MGIAYDPRYVNAKDLDKVLIPITSANPSKVLLRLGTQFKADNVSYYDIYRDGSTGFLRIQGNRPDMADITLPLPKLTNCKNCGGALKSSECEYCGTQYA